MWVVLFLVTKVDESSLKIAWVDLFLVMKKMTSMIHRLNYVGVSIFSTDID